MTGNKQKEKTHAGEQKQPSVSKWLDRITIAIIIIILILCPFALSPHLYDPRLSQTIILQTTLAFLAAIYLPVKILLCRGSISLNILDYSVLLYVGVHYLSAVSGPTPLASLGETGFVTALVGFYFILRLNCLSKAAFPWMLSAMVVSATACAIYGTLQRFGVEFIAYEETERRGKLIVTSFLGNPNYLGSLLAPLAIIAFGLFVSFKHIVLKLTGLICFLAVFMGLIASGCRSAWVGLFLGALLTSGLYLLTQKKENKQKTGVRLYILLALGSVILIAIIAGLSLGNFQLTQRLLSLNEVNSRFLFWQLGLSLFFEHPILGLGPGQLFPQINDAIYNLFTETPDGFIYKLYITGAHKGVPDHLHNEYFQHLAETGFLGLWAFMTFLYLTAKSLFQNRSQSKLFLFTLGGLVAILVDSLWGFPIQLPCSALVFWGIIATAGNAFSSPKTTGKWPVYTLAGSAILVFTLTVIYSVKKWESIVVRVEAFHNPSILNSYKMDLEELESAFWVAPMEDPSPMALIDGYIESNDWNNAEKKITEILSCFNTGGPGYQRLGWVHYRLKNLKEAKKNFHYACVLDPENVEAKELLAYVSMQLGDESDARKFALEVIGEKPGKPNAYYILGTMAKLSGDTATREYYYNYARIAQSNYQGNLLYNPDDLK